MSSELLDQYKALTVELNRLEQEMDRVKGVREGVCGQLLTKDGKGFAYDLGDGLAMVIATTKIGSHYMAPKNKWQKSGRPPKPPKAPKVKSEKPPKETKPAVRRKIVGGKIVEVPVERKSGPPAAAPVQQPAIPKPAPVPAEAKPVAEAPALTPAVKQPDPPKPAAPPQKELDPLEAALADLDIE